MTSSPHNDGVRRSWTSPPTPPSGTGTLHGQQTDVDIEKHVMGKELLEPSVTPIGPDSLEPPDGGLQAWLTVLGATLVGFSTFGVVNAFGAFSDFYNRIYLTNYDSTIISMIGALQVFVLYFFGAFSGAIFDAVGPTYMIPVSGFITAFAFFMLSLTKPEQIYQQFLTQSILFNLGATLGFFPALSVIPHWFRRKAAYAIGCVLAGASGGGIVFPIMLNHLIPRVGFGWAVRSIAFIILSCFAVATFTIKTRRPRKPLPPLYKIINLSAFRDTRYALFAAGAFFNILSVFNPFFYVGLYGVTLHGESKLSPYLLPIMNATSIFGRVLPAILADRVGRFNVICISVLLSSILDFALWYPTTGETPIIVFAALYGFVSGPFFTLMPACVNQISPVESVGGRIGMLFATLSFGALAGTPIGGLFIKTHTRENFQRLIIYTGVLGLVGAAFLILARLRCERRLLARV